MPRVRGRGGEDFVSSHVCFSHWSSHRLFPFSWWHHSLNPSGDLSPLACEDFESFWYHDGDCLDQVSHDSAKASQPAEQYEVIWREYVAQMGLASQHDSRKTQQNMKNPGDTQPTADHATDFTRRPVVHKQSNLLIRHYPGSRTIDLAEIPTQPNTAGPSNRISQGFPVKPIQFATPFSHRTQAHFLKCLKAYSPDSTTCLNQRRHPLTGSRRDTSSSSKHMTRLCHNEGRAQSPPSSRKLNPAQRFEHNHTFHTRCVERVPKLSIRVPFSEEAEEHRRMARSFQRPSTGWPSYASPNTSWLSRKDQGPSQ